MNGYLITALWTLVNLSVVAGIGYLIFRLLRWLKAQDNRSSN